MTLYEQPEDGTQPGELFIGHSAMRGGWCVYLMCDDRECDLVWGPAAEQNAAQRKLDELLAERSK
jgi:hypothetical protein